MSPTKSPPLNAPPLGGLGLDDDDVDGVSSTFAGLRGRRQAATLGADARESLTQVAHTSPLVTTTTFKAPPEPPPPPEKVVRDGYSMPPEDHEKLTALAKACRRADCDIGKSGVLRLGVRILADMPVEKLLELAAALPPVPTAKRKR